MTFLRVRDDTHQPMESQTHHRQLTMPPRSLASFLKAARSALTTHSQRPTPLTFVVGNESAGE